MLGSCSLEVFSGFLSSSKMKMITASTFSHAGAADGSPLLSLRLSSLVVGTSYFWWRWLRVRGFPRPSEVSEIRPLDVVGF